METRKLLELKEDIKHWQSLIREAEAKIKEECPHPPDHVYAKSSYSESGYLDPEYWEYWDECSICGKRFNERTKTGSFR